MPPASRSKRKVVTEEVPAPTPKTEGEGGEHEDIPSTENVILQLPIPPSRLDELMDMSNMHGVLEYNPTLTEPQPYEPADAFVCENDVVDTVEKAPEVTDNKNNEVSRADETPHDNFNKSTCYWCCHPITHMQFGMPVRYDVHFKNFTMFGTFCSLECAAAFNYSEHMGSDRLWEIHSWIQMLAHRYGYTEHVRPAPSRFLLKMFGGPLSIEEFRASHKGLSHTLCMNIPPFIHVNSQMEVLNTSFLETKRSLCTTKAPKKKSVIASKSIFPSSST